MTFIGTAADSALPPPSAAREAPRRYPMPELTSADVRVDALADYFIEVVVKLQHDGRISDEEAGELIKGWDQVALYGVS